ncbi:hypothetical protein [Lancefieldella parvula]|uniref:hypothetical protein n=1 Tax=Lancefieldella parvula TaxID=1382 RepID=UPI00291072EF|nr:hypothetical protein [Lancefieldella parvula]MDU4868400.1 hypothetical protein [Lancefieldella parvula]
MDDLSPLQKVVNETVKPSNFSKIHTPFEDMTDVSELLQQTREIQDWSIAKAADLIDATPLDEQLRINELLVVLREQARVLNAQNEAFRGYVEDARKETWFSRIVSVVSVVIALASLLVAVFTLVPK